MAIYRGIGGSGETNQDALESAVTEQAVDAANSASEAASSATAAASSATAAASSASSASSSASSASTSATTAASEASDAATSATAAAGSATSAATSATTATTQATAASTSATNAAASETAAAASETAAAASQTAAATSATNAATSATAASTSATSASTSATNASTSASNAASSASSAASSASAAQAAEDAALAALDSFDDRYLGQKTSDPTVDNDGNALVAGALYFNTSDNAMKVYDGSNWLAAYASLSGALIATNNLSDLVSASAARTNLGLGTAATTASTDYVATTGDSMTGNLTFGDNDKAIFGAGSDLQIYHDGSNSYIKDVGTGSLIISTDGSEASLVGSGGSQYMVRGYSGGAVRLYHNGIYKLETTSTGIDVTGTVTADGLTVDGDITINDNSPTLTFLDANGVDQNFNFAVNGGTANIQSRTDAGVNTTRFQVETNGDISFYEDTGTTPKFFWDASAERLGIGTSSPSAKLEIKQVDGTPDTGFQVTRYNNDNQYLSLWATGGLRYIDAVGDSSVSSVLSFRRSIDSGSTFSESMRIDSSGNVGIGTSTITSPASWKTIRYGDVSAITDIETGNVISSNWYYNSGHKRIASGYAQRMVFGTNGEIDFDLAGTSTADSAISWSTGMRIDSSGNLLVGKTTADLDIVGCEVRGSLGYLSSTRDGGHPLDLNRQTSDGAIAQFRKDGTTVGSIGSVSGAYLYIGDSGAVGMSFVVDRVRPATDGLNADNVYDFGHPTVRWDDIYATNGTIQTSDANEKQDIASLTSAEMNVAKALSSQFKTFRWIDSVEDKGDSARTHSGIIAQDVKAAFEAEGLDAGKYALFISSTWWETQTEVPAVEAVDAVLDDDGNVIEEAVEAKDAYTRTDTYDTAEEAPEGATERTRLGIRYPELLSFMAAYNDQRFTDIESRLAALENN